MKINETTLQGNAYKVEERTFDSGSKMKTFSFKFNNRKDKQTGEWSSDWITVKAFDVASNLELKDKDALTVKGWIKQEKWTAKDGTARNQIVLMAKNIEYTPQEPSGLDKDEDIPF